MKSLAVIAVALQLVTLAASECKQEFGCSGGSCDFTVTWTKTNANIKFTMTGKVDSAQHWVGVGFSEGATMLGADTWIGWISSGGKAVVSDRFIALQTGYDNGALPDTDKAQPTRFDGSNTNGRTTITFSRSIAAQSSKDDLPLDKKLYLLAAVGGTPSDDKDRLSTIGYHQKRWITTKKIDFSNC